MKIFISNFKTRKLSAFFFAFSFSLFFSQKIVRSSDNSSFGSVTIVNKDKKVELKDKDISSFVFEEGDKVEYNGKLVDFSIDNDTLFFFDKIKIIDEKVINSKKKSNAVEEIPSYKKLNNICSELIPNSYIATFIERRKLKKSFIKSFTIYPFHVFYKNNIYHNHRKEKLRVKILPNKNGNPDFDNPISEFETSFSDFPQKKWEINLPNILKIPEEGFFICLFLQNEENAKPVILTLTNKTQLITYKSREKKWDFFVDYGLKMQIKTLQ